MVTQRVLGDLVGLAEISQPIDYIGSPGRARTADLVINSHPLYQLSYRGIKAGYGTDGSEDGQLSLDGASN
jgi:hypothetical protein